MPTTPIKPMAGENSNSPEIVDLLIDMTGNAPHPFRLMSPNERIWPGDILIYQQTNIVHAPNLIGVLRSKKK